MKIQTTFHYHLYSQKCFLKILDYRMSSSRCAYCIISQFKRQNNRFQSYFCPKIKLFLTFFSGNISRRPIITWTSPTGYYPRPHFRIGKMPPDPTGPDPRGSAGPYPLSISGKTAVLVIISNYCPNKLGRNILFDIFLEISKLNFSKKDVIFLILTLFQLVKDIKVIVYHVTKPSAKGSFFSESAICLSNLQKNYSKSLS